MFEIVAKLADALDLDFSGDYTVWVLLPPISLLQIAVVITCQQKSIEVKIPV